MEQTIERRWHEIWMEQCEAAVVRRVGCAPIGAISY